MPWFIMNFQLYSFYRLSMANWPAQEVRGHKTGLHTAVSTQSKLLIDGAILAVFPLRLIGINLA